MSAAICWCQREQYNRIKPHRTPGVREPLEWINDQYLAIDHTIPVRHRFGPELELSFDPRFEVVVHQPLRDELAFGESTPQLFWCMWEGPIGNDSLCILCGVAHGSILSKSVSRRSNRPCQNAL